MKFAEIWEAITKSRYTCLLEQELERARIERDGFRDALLQHMNLPRIAKSEPKPLPTMKRRTLPTLWRQKMEAVTTPKEAAVEEKTA